MFGTKLITQVRIPTRRSRYSVGKPFAIDNRADAPFSPNNRLTDS